MNRKGIFIFTVALASAMADVDAQSLRVDLKQRGHEVNEDMYGIFFEEINHAGDGGLYAEMVQNRGFEEHVLPRGMVYRDGKIYAPNLPSYATHEKADWSDKWDMEAKKMLGWRVEAEGCRVAHEVSEPEYPLHKNTPNAPSNAKKSKRQKPSSFFFYVLPKIVTTIKFLSTRLTAPTKVASPLPSRLSETYRVR